MTGPPTPLRARLMRYLNLPRRNPAAPVDPKSASTPQRGGARGSDGERRSIGAVAIENFGSSSSSAVIACSGGCLRHSASIAIHAREPSRGRGEPSRGADVARMSPVPDERRPRAKSLASAAPVSHRVGRISCAGLGSQNKATNGAPVRVGATLRVADRPTLSGNSPKWEWP